MSSTPKHAPQSRAESAQRLSHGNDTHLKRDNHSLARPQSRQQRARAARPGVRGAGWAAQRCPARCGLRQGRSAASSGHSGRSAAHSGQRGRTSPHGPSCKAKRCLSAPGCEAQRCSQRALRAGTLTRPQLQDRRASERKAAPSVITASPCSQHAGQGAEAKLQVIMFCSPRQSERSKCLL